MSLVLFEIDRPCLNCGGTRFVLRGPTDEPLRANVDAVAACFRCHYEWAETDDDDPRWVRPDGVEPRYGDADYRGWSK